MTATATRISLGCGCQTVTSSYGERPAVGQTFECLPHGWVHITATQPEPRHHAGPSKADVAKALKQLKAELESPAFAAALEADIPEPR